jgi:hypothetical protein
MNLNQKVGKKHILGMLEDCLLEEIYNELTEDQAEQLEKNAELSFAWAYEGEDTCTLRLIGLINGLLAEKGQVLRMEYDENRRFVGLSVKEINTDAPVVMKTNTRSKGFVEK